MSRSRAIEVVAALGLLLACAGTPALAGEVRLRNGIILEGEIISVDEARVVIELQGLRRRIAIPRERVLEIIGVPGSQPPQQPQLPAVEPERLPEVFPGVEGFEPPDSSLPIPEPENYETVAPGTATELGTISSFVGASYVQRRGAASFTPLAETTSRILYGGEVLRTGAGGHVSALFINLLQVDLGERSVAQLLVSPFNTDERLFRVKLIVGEIRAAKPQDAFYVDVGEARVRGDHADLRVARVGELGTEVVVTSGHGSLDVLSGPTAELDEGEGVRISEIAQTEAGPRFEIVATGAGAATVRPGGRNGAVALRMGPGSRATTSPLEGGALSLELGEASLVLPSEQAATVDLAAAGIPRVTFRQGTTVGLLEGLDTEVSYADDGSPVFPFRDGSTVTVHDGVALDLHNPYGILANGARFELASPLQVELFVAQAPFFHLQYGLASILLGPNQNIVLGRTPDGSFYARNPIDQRQILVAPGQRARIFLLPDGTIRVLTDDRSAELPPISPPSVTIGPGGDMVVYDGARHVRVGPGQLAQVVPGAPTEPAGTEAAQPGTVVSADYRFRDIPYPGREMGGFFEELPEASPTSP